MPVSWLWSESVLMKRSFLWLLFLSNAAGTAYGYIWYGNQLAYTLDNHPLWRIVFVPDSPTASLFFTFVLLFFLFPPKVETRGYLLLRMVVEALAVVTLVKYGIWAVTMNAAQGAQGEALNWQNWMLIASHSAMAVEGLLYVRFMRFGRMAAALAFGWILLNDAVDYTFEVYPWLPRVLIDNIQAIRNFTVGLSAASFLVTLLALAHKRSLLYRNSRRHNAKV
ncbi:hypothetical protein BG53_03780 [Paenibacillus darwinianus]|uniref:DUF1405 domain-containing protein n=1 Tax=Paenibacillus darwinianus TaxID=1380763 RepID=A0A9W5S3Q0_9BACL|nr:DUF1405 domain-containing protein [Paenibacillus darwinianus]EXX91301.1 hypothetical protein BG52_11030 [Paenibacillus darwinianus]EXX92117.1 hypothetical protein BG53_03780 [Paenibacillus darwinianus]EXX92554.1 hypothetical protein CH50_10220 [Paenibacillus darwinianus]